MKGILLTPGSDLSVFLSQVFDGNRNRPTSNYKEYFCSPEKVRKGYLLCLQLSVLCRDYIDLEDRRSLHFLTKPNSCWLTRQII